MLFKKELGYAYTRINIGLPNYNLNFIVNSSKQFNLEDSLYYYAMHNTTAKLAL
jgi:hypothetical protein